MDLRSNKHLKFLIHFCTYILNLILFCFGVQVYGMVVRQPYTLPNVPLIFLLPTWCCYCNVIDHVFWHVLPVTITFLTKINFFTVVTMVLIYTKANKLYLSLCICTFLLSKKCRYNCVLC